MLYEEFVVWRRITEKTAVKYRCLKNCETKMFSVQSADFYHPPLTEKRVLEFEAQFVELFCENDPAERAGAFASLEEAIAAHDRNFVQAIRADHCIQVRSVLR